MWGVAVTAIPLLVAGLDLLTRRRLTNFLRELLFQPDDTQLPEPRDTVWAIAFVAVGLGLAVWGMKELLAPAKVLVADREGLRLRSRGPLREPWFVAWEAIEDVGSGTVSDEGTTVPVLWLRLATPEMMPQDPWGARPIQEQTLAVLAADWDTSHVDAAERIGRLASYHLARLAWRTESGPLSDDEAPP